MSFFREASMPSWQESLERDGFTILRRVYSPDMVQRVLRELAGALDQTPDAESRIASDDGTVYAARNVLDLWPAATALWRAAPLPIVLASALGPHFGLVRGLFFDKPPARSWALPWHKDKTIAVKDNRVPSRHFTKPTMKAGVPHVEAPPAVLERMLTVRIHLDPMTSANGPLKVLPGTHRTRQVMPSAAVSPQSVMGDAGDVLVMRPLLAHASGKSDSETGLHRRVLHLEFAADPNLTEGYEWHRFIPAVPDEKDE
jgi:ectoine hydroxylase-related dioxygenase (phytanoyl-CoA dioxygenase family)